MSTNNDCGCILLLYDCGLDALRTLFITHYCVEWAVEYGYAPTRALRPTPRPAPCVLRPAQPANAACEQTNILRPQEKVPEKKYNSRECYVIGQPFHILFYRSRYPRALRHCLSDIYVGHILASIKLLRCIFSVLQVHASIESFFTYVFATTTVPGSLMQVLPST